MYNVSAGRRCNTDISTTSGISNSGGADSATTGPRGEKNDAIVSKATGTPRSKIALARQTQCGSSVLERFARRSATSSAA